MSQSAFFLVMTAAAGVATVGAALAGQVSTAAVGLGVVALLAERVKTAESKEQS